MARIASSSIDESREERPPIWSSSLSKKSIISWGGRSTAQPPELHRGKSRTSEGTNAGLGARRHSDPIPEESGPPAATIADIQDLEESMKLQAHLAKDNLTQEISHMEKQMKGFFQESLRAESERIREVSERLNEQASVIFSKIDQTTKDLSARIEDVKSEVANAKANAFIEAKEYADEQIKFLESNLNDMVRTSGDQMKASFHVHDTRISANEGSIDSVREKLNKYMKDQESVASAVSGRLAELHRNGDEFKNNLSCEVTHLHTGLERLQQEIAATVSSLRMESDSRLQTIEKRTTELCTQSSQILSMPVRRVEWVIRDASRFLDDAYRASIKSWGCWQHDEMEIGDTRMVTPWRCWFSPEFEASGANSLQLELQVLPTLRQRSRKQEEVDDESVSNESNDCILRLWAPKGVYMHCKLHVGSEVMELQHEFDGDSPCAMKRCLLSDAFDALADALHFGVDVLEVFQGFDRPTVALSSVRGEAAFEDSPTSADGCGDHPRGSLRLYNHLCPGSSVQLGKIEDQLNLVKSRLVGRVEWVLHDASTMQEFFPQGEYVCSPVFTASGAEGLQLIFFPSGEAGATACWCSLYLYYPGKTQLQCWLSVGKQRRDITHAPRDRPGFFGRANFAIYQMVIDHASDSLTLAVEICDVQTSGNAIVAYEPAPRAVPWPQRLSEFAAPLGGFPKVLEECGRKEDSHGDEPMRHMDSPQVLEHTSRLQERGGRLAFHDVKILPSIFSLTKPEVQPSQGAIGVWSFRPKIVSKSGTPEGYFRCNDLRPPRQDAKLRDPIEICTTPPRATSNHGNELSPIRRTPNSPRPNSEPLFKREASPSPKPLPTLPKEGPANLVNRARTRGRPGGNSRGVNPKSALASVPPGVRPDVPPTPRTASACDASPDSEALLANCG